VTDQVPLADLGDWATAQGNWQAFGESATYLGFEAGNEHAGVLLAPDEQSMTRGAMSATVHLDENGFDSQARIVFGRNADTGAYMAAGLGGHNARFVVEEWEPDHQHLRRINVGGPAPGQWPTAQNLTVKIKARHLSLMVNGATVLRALLPRALRSGEQVGVSAWGSTRVSFDAITIEREAPAAFVVMQFDGYEDVYGSVIQPVGDDVGVDVKRADEYLKPGSIIADIERGIAESDLVIAEISENNANVFYEVGYAYALEKPVLLLAKQGRRLPFDLLVERCFFYDASPPGLTGAAEELRSRVEAALAGADL
jgi:hypothetical protein